MTYLLSFLIPAAFLLIADAAGWIDLSSRPLARVVKWLAAATVAWFLPLFAKEFFHLRIDEKHLELWKLLILAVLGIALSTTLFKWVWTAYGPVAEGYRRCPYCRKPILKIMLECPVCRKTLNEA